MSTTEASPALCPVCSVRSLVVHCDSKTCHWHRCRSKDCEAVLDLAKRRGFATKDGVTRHIEIP